eukprot:gnl/MRDRNA2_/MRDRNA2_136568_c0_seq1.p1 gnl/MRDRNA2_/MRDRNA2_136568_c0~~gnl/MRDRNA2_/MRDRNA2_136568_c0_seq1.p1  ORF type:complete len:365 (-),score=62.45 gnl/MRDRNA2_/MRDRNA2_136568_c0_seq1:32-1006(-)
MLADVTAIKPDRGCVTVSVRPHGWTKNLYLEQVWPVKSADSACVSVDTTWQSKDGSLVPKASWESTSVDVRIVTLGLREVLATISTYLSWNVAKLKGYVREADMTDESAACNAFFDLICDGNVLGDSQKLGEVIQPPRATIYLLRNTGALLKPGGFCGKALLDPDWNKSWTIAARIRTTSGGPIVAKSKGPDLFWVLHGKVLFVRGEGGGSNVTGNVGCVSFEVGMMGGIYGNTEVADGWWHDVVAVHEADSGRVTLYVDGEEDASALINQTADAKETCTFVGQCASNFPYPTDFDGDLQVSWHSSVKLPFSLDVRTAALFEDS